MWMNARYGIVPAVAVCLCENILSTNLSGQWYYILPVYRMHYYNYALTEIQRKSIHAPYVWESIVYYGVLIGICLFIIALQTRKYEFAVMKSREDGDE